MKELSPAFISAMNQMGQSQQPFLFIIDYLCEEPLLIPLSEAASQGIYFRTPALTNRQSNRPVLTEPVISVSTPVSWPHYRQKLARLKELITAGDTWLANLTVATPVSLGADLMTLFDAAAAPYQLCYQNQWACFSPESFVTFKDRLITTRPMKGTRMAGPGAEQALLNDEKEQAEHVTVVDLLRNDLAQVSGNVHVSSYRYLETISNGKGGLLQTSSEITGELPPDWIKNMGGIIARLLPAGSVTGAPKQRTVQILQELEDSPRGYYTGIFGVFDGHTLDSAVMIRFIEKTAQGYQYRSGGGIRIDSDPQMEYDEILEKIYVPLG